ncbi:MAG: SurA N-terminal domain-containing protein, partial [Gammaproteobacteria bacterium]
MLQSIRDRLTGILAFVVLGILVIPFAFVGVNSYFGSGTGNLVALVNDEEITFNQFNQSFLDYRRRMQAQLGEAFDPDEYSSEIARREHLDQMIDEVILRQTADSLGFSVSDERLAEEIRNIPAFQVDGQFSPEVYQARLTSIGQTPKQFQNLMRADIAVTQLPGGISRSSFSTSRELDEFVAMSRQKRSFRYISVPADDAAVTDEFTEEELQTAYEENRELFRTPEQVVIEYLELSPDNIDTGGDPGDDVLRALFEEQKQRFVTPEQRRVSHVLVEVTPDSDAVTIETARQEAEAIAERARAGEDFAALAEELSDDLGSASVGGDLGFIEPGVMVEAFEDAAYELSLENPVSDPVQTGFGWHVIKLTDLRESSGQTFEEARQTLLDEWRDEQIEREFLDLADRMVDVVYEDPTTLEAAALDLGLEIQQAGPFSRGGGEGVAADPDVVEAAFSDLVLLQGSVSDPVDLGPNHMIMLRVLEHEPSAIQPLDEVRDQVTEVLRSQRALEAARER